ncbi:hypothetical protein [Amycolatopsis sacchari]|nr:hypothetical protein [Amycolatopsis sacchari]
MAPLVPGREKGKLTMSDTAEYYTKLRDRAAKLAQSLDDAVVALAVTHIDVEEIGKGDIGDEAEMSETSLEDLRRCVANAAFHVRMAEQINNSYLRDLSGYLENLGLDVTRASSGRAG